MRNPLHVKMNTHASFVVLLLLILVSNSQGRSIGSPIVETTKPTFEEIVVKKLIGIENAIELHDEKMNNMTGKCSNPLKERKCYNGWMTYENHCYCLSNETQTWQKSEQACIQLGSHLVKVDDDQENQWIVSKMPEGGYILWLGGTDIYHEGDWIWTSDFFPLNYTNWDEGHHEPNGQSNENCLSLTGTSLPEEHTKWNDLPCNQELYYLCEKELD